MNKYLKQNGIKLLVFIIIAAVLVGVFSRQGSDGSTGALTGASTRVRLPVQGVVSSMADWLEGLYGYVYRYDTLKAENNTLRAQLAAAQEEARQSAEAAEENVRLRALLGYLEKHTTFVTEGAQITAWDASNWTSAFTISKGSAQGIAAGDCVITEAGMLVGQVYEVDENWANVRTAIDVNMDCGVFVGDAGIPAMLVGDYALMRQRLCKLSYFTEDATIFVGDRVTTSGSGGAFPAGISVGVITELRTEAGGQSIYAVIKPNVDLGSLSQVFIIKDFEVIE